METLYLTFSWVFISLSATFIILAVVIGWSEDDAEAVVFLVLAAMACIFIGSLFCANYNELKSNRKINHESRLQTIN